MESLSHIWHFVTSWTAARQPSLSFTVSRNLFKLMSIESVVPSSVVFFSSCCLQSFPASASFPMSWLFAPGGQIVRASASFLPVSILGWFHRFNPWSGKVPHAVEQLKPVLHNYRAWALGPTSCNHWSLCAQGWCSASREASTMRDLYAATKSKPCPQQLKKVCAEQGRPVQPKISKYFF